MQFYSKNIQLSSGDKHSDTKKEMLSWPVIAVSQ